jgi:hypothetical protein
MITTSVIKKEIHTMGDQERINNLQERLRIAQFNFDHAKKGIDHHGSIANTPTGILNNYNEAVRTIDDLITQLWLLNIEVNVPAEQVTLIRF